MLFFCIADYSDIQPLLEHICKHPELIKEYAKKAFEYGKKNHSQIIIQKKSSSIFSQIINQNSQVDDIK